MPHSVIHPGELKLRVFTTSSSEAMKYRVMQAIRERRLLRVDYGRRKGLTVAPQAFGETGTGYLAVLCWLEGPAPAGGTPWRLLDFSHIRRVEILPEHFRPPPRGPEVPAADFHALQAVV